jgi:hypothetical protein
MVSVQFEVFRDLEIALHVFLLCDLFYIRREELPPVVSYPLMTLHVTIMSTPTKYKFLVVGFKRKQHFN